MHAATAGAARVFSPDGALRETIEMIHALLGAGRADGILWDIGKGAEQAEKFMKELPEEAVDRLHDDLVAACGAPLSPQRGLGRRRQQLVD